MTHEPPHGLAAPQVPTKPYFSSEDWEKFQSEDKQAAAMVVGLMGAIFSIGLVLYSVILLITSSSP